MLRDLDILKYTNYPNSQSTIISSGVIVPIWYDYSCPTQKS